MLRLFITRQLYDIVFEQYDREHTLDVRKKKNVQGVTLQAGQNSPKQEKYRFFDSFVAYARHTASHKRNIKVRATGINRNRS
jgi:hypothetical protein